MAKRAFLIHGWQGSPEEGWRPWLKRELEKKGFSVLAPAMPEPDYPQAGPWVSRLAEVVGKPDKDCTFVGHSLGCITILRYLEALEEGQGIGGAVLVAGFSDSLGYRELEGFFARPIDWSTLKSRCRKFVAIASDNDPYVPLKHGHIFRNRLGARLVIEHNRKHFAGEDGITELPSALEAVLQVSR